MAQDLDVLIKSAQFDDSTEYKGALVMKVWPNHTVFIDWLSPDAGELWHTGLYDLYQQVPYDGIWIDMNEATGFTNGELDVSQETKEKIVNMYRERANRFLAEERYND
jgi:alpha-glucosidase (family GH31 glycosyl hydrolase)